MCDEKMKKVKLISMLVAAMVVGITTTVSAAQLESGHIGVTIGDNFYGTVTPEINIGEENSITLDAIKVVDGSNVHYRVNDSITIPLVIHCLKENVKVRKPPESVKSECYILNMCIKPDFGLAR